MNEQIYRGESQYREERSMVGRSHPVQETIQRCVLRRTVEVCNGLSDTGAVPILQILQERDLESRSAESDLDNRKKVI